MKENEFILQLLALCDRIYKDALAYFLFQIHFDASDKYLDNVLPKTNRCLQAALSKDFFSSSLPTFGILYSLTSTCNSTRSHVVRCRVIRGLTISSPTIMLFTHFYFLSLLFYQPTHFIKMLSELCLHLPQLFFLLSVCSNLKVTQIRVHYSTLLDLPWLETNNCKIVYWTSSNRWGRPWERQRSFKIIW